MHVWPRSLHANIARDLAQAVECMLLRRIKHNSEGDAALAGVDQGVDDRPSVSE